MIRYLMIVGMAMGWNGLSAQQTPGGHPGIQQKIDTSYEGGGAGSLLKKDCNSEYPADKYSQCVCECQNRFIDEIKKCPTEPCIGAASLARTACIAGCSRMDD
jgi:hypothetical protein